MKDFFRAYVPTHNKKCTVAFKGVDSSDLYNYEEIQSFSEYAGILSEDTILIDIDDYDQSEILMNIVEDLQLACRVYETTRGKHFLFYNFDEKGNYLQTKNKIKCKLACGLIADIKLGCKNSYSVLKYKNENRKIIYDIFEDEDYETVPKFLLPVKCTTDFLSLETGDGRNQALFNYILTLQSHDFSVEECKNVIRLINNYILKDPLSDAELEIILRDEILAQKKGKKGKRRILKETNIKPFIDKYNISIRDDIIVLNIRLLAGTEKNLNPSLLFDTLIRLMNMDFEWKSISRISLLDKDYKEFK